jgi:hypothetical protein
MEELFCLIMVLNDLQRINEKVCGEIPLEELMGIWRGNHGIMLDYFASNNFPFFGLHGTTKDGLAAILKTKDAGVQLGTFYDKNKDEFRLFQLYALCSYVSGYSRDQNREPESQGGVLVFDLQSNDRNITYPWENLFGCNGLGYPLVFDTEEHREMFDKLGDSKNLLYRTADRFQGEKFDQRYMGFIEPSIIRLSKTGLDSIYALARLDWQYDLANVFDLVSSRKK